MYCLELYYLIKINRKLKFMALPHITNSEAGRNKYDPYHNCLFEVYFTLPTALRADFAQDEALLTEHVLKVSGLDSLDKGPDKTIQKYQGTTRTYLKPKLDDTSFDIQVDFSLNLRNGVDNYIFRLLKSWSNLCYDKESGTIVLKKDYCSDWLRIAVANRAGDIIRDVVFKDVMLYGNLEGLGDLDYESTEPVNLTVHFVSDWAKDVLAQ